MNNDNEEEYFYCLYCGRRLKVKDGIVVHDNVHHPEDYDFNESEKPQ